MHVIEQFVQGKKPQGPSGGEDVIMVTDGFIALLDGVTSRGRAVDEGLLLDGSTPGRWAALVIGETVATFPADIDAHDAFLRLSHALAERQRQLGVDPAAWGWPAAAQTTVFSKHRQEVWRVGDIHIAVNGEELPASPTPLDGPAVAFRAAVLWAMRAAGHRVEDLQEDDPTWEMLLPLLELQHHLRNHDDVTNPFAYGLLDGRDVHESYIQVFPVPHGAEVVLASDGYLSPASSLAEAERDLAACLAGDPLLISAHRGFRPLSPGTVSFDDRAYIRFVA